MCAVKVVKRKESRVEVWYGRVLVQLGNAAESKRIVQYGAVEEILELRLIKYSKREVG